MKELEIALNYLQAVDACAFAATLMMLIMPTTFCLLFWHKSSLVKSLGRRIGAAVLFTLIGWVMLATNTKTITKTSTKNFTREDAFITKDDWAVLQIIRENPSVSAEEIGSRLGLSRAGAIYHINKFKAIAKLRRVGTPRNGRWEVMWCRRSMNCQT